MVSRFALGSLLCLAIACSDEAVPVGNQDGQPLDYTAPGLHKGEAMCPGGDDDEPKVDWEGYVENARDPILADRVRIRVPQDDAPGFVMFGSGPELPAPTGTGEVFTCVDPQKRWLEGHRYEMLDPLVSERRLRFKIWQAEPYAPWCELQDPQGPCGHKAKVFASPCHDSRDEEVDCELMLLCMSCTCDSHGCHAVPQSINDFTSLPAYSSFDIALNGDRAQGSALLLSDDGVGKLLLYATE
jgi:hypothetical protein